MAALAGLGSGFDQSAALIAPGQRSFLCRVGLSVEVPTGLYECINHPVSVLHESASAPPRFVVSAVVGGHADAMAGRRRKRRCRLRIWRRLKQRG